MVVYLWGKCADVTREGQLANGDLLLIANAHVTWNAQIGKYALYCGANSRVNKQEEE